MATITVGPRIKEGYIKFYDQHFESRNAGVTLAISFLPDLYSTTIHHELAGKFESNELKMILDIENAGTEMMTWGPMAATVGIKANIFDSFSLYPGAYEDKWSVDRESMQTKIAALTVFQEFVIKLWASIFWDRQSDSDPDFMDRHISIMLKPNQNGYVAPKPIGNLNPT